MTWETKGKYRWKIVPDPDPISPAEWDEPGELYYLKSSRYTLGSKQVSRDELDALKEDADGANYVFPYYAYIHSGVTISLGAFSCQWDSGCCGLVVIPKDNPCCGKIETEEKAREIAESLVKEWDMYLTGDVWGYVIEREDENGEPVEVDSLLGIYGREDAEDECRGALKGAMASEREQRREARKLAAMERLTEGAP